MTRIAWVDFARGIGILLVVYAHTMEPRDPFIYSFHVPFFFAVSGFLFTDGAHTPIRYARRKAQRLLIPQIFLSLLSGGVMLLDKILAGEGIQAPLLAIAKTFYFTDVNGGNSPLWFLACLFSTSVIYCTMSSLLHARRHVLLATLILSVLGYLYAGMGLPNLPLMLNVACCALPYYAFGHILGQAILNGRLASLNVRFCVVLAVAGLIYGTATVLNLRTHHIARVNMVSQVYGNYFLFYAAGFCGTLLVLTACKTSCNTLLAGSRLAFVKNAVCFVGRISIVLLFSHGLVFGVLNNILTLFGGPLDHSLFRSVLYAASAVIVTIPLAFLFYTFCPVLIGDKRGSDFDLRAWCQRAT